MKDVRAIGRYYHIIGLTQDFEESNEERYEERYSENAHIFFIEKKEKGMHFNVNGYLRRVLTEESVSMKTHATS
jgi:hypothetical protein